MSVTQPQEHERSREGLQDLFEVMSRVRSAVESVVVGKPDVVQMAVTVLLAEGHLLVEDVPGVGKTLLAKALGQATGCAVRRVQFTPDLLPSDLTGVSVYDASTRSFEFKPGPVFANVVVGDEINRASPKTQSALLECMAERQVTVDGLTYPLPPPFMVVATQNPAEMEGTYALPEAQRDRFMARVSMGYPSPDAELAMLDQHGASDPLEDLLPVADPESVRRAAVTASGIHASPAVKQYLLDLVAGTRAHPDVALGASPRASLHLLRAARAAAALDGRDHVLPDDVQELLAPVLAHRLMLTPDAQMGQRSVTDVLDGLLRSVAISSGPRTAGR